jgi:sulfite reductase (NADPH) hemoprotein beta-component
MMHITIAQPKPSKNENLKESDPTLGGTIARTLRDPAADRFSADDSYFLKFHGIYQQDDRDLRKIGKEFIFMVRCRIPGGVLSPEQYLACDDLATRHGNATLRVTSRQGLQFHGVVKSGLGPLVKSIHHTLLTTLSACGDVSRNVMAPATPPQDALGAQVRKHARTVAEALAPRKSAYHAIWVDGVSLELDEKPEKQPVDPLYGKSYLPRKFKLGFAIPPRNDVDILTHCCGFIAIADAAGALAGYVLTAGGGMGRSHANEATFPRLADTIGFLPQERVVDVAKGVLTIHRDFGDRANRKHARLKYVLEDRGVEWFREELARRLGFPLSPAPPFAFAAHGDPMDWHRQDDGRWFLGLFVETGRIRDSDGVRLKTVLRDVVERYRPEVRLTPGNNVVLAGIEPALVDRITAQFAANGVSIGGQGSVLRRASMACVALPTCGLAVAESERYLPKLILRIQDVLSELGIPGEEILIRMTGCRPIGRPVRDLAGRQRHRHAPQPHVQGQRQRRGYRRHAPPAPGPVRRGTQGRRTVRRLGRRRRLERVMDTLSTLENRSIYVLREAYGKLDRLAMLWSIGKDSTVLLWLARKAFFGHVPFPLVHVDTSYKLPSMIEYRDRLCAEWNLKLVVGKNDAALRDRLTFPDGAATRVACCGRLKRDALQAVLDEQGYTGVIVGVRRDEDPTRAKERYFSPRNRQMEWNVADQPPEMWDLFKTELESGTHVRVHPLLHWTELDVWEYIERESIPVIPLYFADEKGFRYRSLGCHPCTFPVPSRARSVPEIIDELRQTRVSERTGRAQDGESEGAFESLRRDGYM